MDKPDHIINVDSGMFAEYAKYGFGYRYGIPSDLEGVIADQIILLAEQDEGQCTGRTLRVQVIQPGHGALLVASTGGIGGC